MKYEIKNLFDLNPLFKTQICGGTQFQIKFKQLFNLHIQKQP